MKVRNLDVWGGKSHYIRSIKSSVFLTGRYSYARFSRRPPVTADYNPALHDHDAMLFGGAFHRTAGNISGRKGAKPMWKRLCRYTLLQKEYLRFTIPRTTVSPYSLCQNVTVSGMRFMGWVSAWD